MRKVVVIKWSLKLIYKCVISVKRWVNEWVRLKIWFECVQKCQIKWNISKIWTKISLLRKDYTINEILCIFIGREKLCSLKFWLDLSVWEITFVVGAVAVSAAVNIGEKCCRTRRRVSHVESASRASRMSRVSRRSRRRVLKIASQLENGRQSSATEHCRRRCGWNDWREVAVVWVCRTKSIEVT